MRFLAVLSYMTFLVAIETFAQAKTVIDKVAWLLKCLLGCSFLCKYYYLKSKDEQMLSLTSFKIAADFLNN